MDRKWSDLGRAYRTTSGHVRSLGCCPRIGDNLDHQNYRDFGMAASLTALALRGIRLELDIYGAADGEADVQQ